MKNCLAEIDPIFLNSNGVTAVHRILVEPLQGLEESIVSYYRRLQRYGSYQLAQFAIELAK